MCYQDSKAVQRRFHISRSTLYRWIDDPEIAFPSPVRIGSRVLWREADLAAFDERIADLNSAPVVGVQLL